MRAPTTTAGSARSSGMFDFSEVCAGRGLLVSARHRGVQRAGRAEPRDGRASAATSRSRRRRSTTARCGRPRGTGTSTTENMFVTEYEDRQMAVKPMNCPGHCKLYSMQPPLLPRPAAALLGAGPAAPPRAERHAARPAARAPLRPGRLAHLLHRGPDPGRGRGRARVRVRDLPAVRRSTSGSSSRRGPSSGSAPTSCGTTARRRCSSALESPGARVRPQRGRRRLLRPEDRHAHDRLARPLAGSSAPASSTTTCRSASGSPTPAPTTPSTSR